MSNSPAIVIDLSCARWPGEPAMELAAPDGTLSDAEMAELTDAITETDAELEAMVPDFTEFDAAFTARAQAD
jgi:hypothetical protein